MPPRWLDQISVEDIILALGGLVAIGLVVIGIVKVVHPVMTKIVRVLDLILGRPKIQGIPGKPSMMDRFDSLDERMDAQDEAIKAIKAEVTPNHGTSAHDAITKRIDRVEANTDRVEAKVDAVLAHLGITPDQQQ